MFSVDEYFFLAIFLPPSLLPQSNSILQKYFTLFFDRGIFIILSLYLLTIVTATTNLLTESAGLQAVGSDWWHGAGLAFTFGHFVYVPWISPPVKGIREDRWKGKFRKNLRIWLKAHLVQSLTTDLPGWFFFLLAVLRTMHLWAEVISLKKTDHEMG
jgi:hypothetical protein